MWILGVVVVVVIGACVVALFLLPGRGPFAALSDVGRRGRIYGSRGVSDFHADTRRRPNEPELL